jgi:myosin heavy subunit
LHLDSLRQTRDSFEVAQRVLSIEDSCIEESMLTRSRANSSIDSDHNGYSYENLIDDDLDRVALDMYELAAIQIQSVYRGFWVRDCLDVDHYCATAVQRMYRGLSCRKAYALDVQRIILVQSWWRRNIARDKAANILAYAIMIQSAFRSHMVRKRCRLYHEKAFRVKNSAATSIQSRWRSFVCEAHFIRTLVDVLIVQTVVRRWLAHQKVAKARKRKQQTSEHLCSKTSLRRVAYIPRNSEGANELRESTKTSYIVSLPIPTRIEYERIKSTNSTDSYSKPKTKQEHNSSNEAHLASPPVSLRNQISPGKSIHGTIVNNKNLDVAILNDAKWTTAAARCITPETKKMYTKSKVVAYPISDDEGSKCNESYRIVRNTEVVAETNRNKFTVDGLAEFESTKRLLPAEDAPYVTKEGTTTNLLSIWKEKEKRNAYPHRKALV